MGWTPERRAVPEQTDRRRKERRVQGHAEKRAVRVKLWVNRSGLCLPTVVASLVDRDPGDLPATSDPAVMDEWLRDHLGLRLEPVYGEYVADLPSEPWIALEGRGPALASAVLARGAEAFHDPAGGKPLDLWANLAARNYPHMPLGYRIRPA